MGSVKGWKVVPQVEREEPADVYVSGLDRVEIIGDGRLRFVMYVVDTEVDHPPRRVPAPMDIVMDASAVPDAIGKAIIALAHALRIRANGTIAVAQ